MTRLLRFRQGRKVYYFVTAALVALVATSCSGNLTADAPRAAGDADPAYVLTVDLAPGDSREAVERRTGGKVVVWAQDAYAVVGLDDDSELHTLGGRSRPQANTNAFLAGGQAAWMNGRSRVWAGGRSTVWAGGTSDLWWNGKSRLWAGGEFSWMPENTALWRQIHLEQGQALAPNLGYGVKVAIIDTGVDIDHPALTDALAPREEWYDFYADDANPQEQGGFSDPGFGHGTNVAGIVRQIAPRATILPLRVLGPDGGGNIADVTAAIQWAVDHGADVINLSLGSDMTIDAVEAALTEANARGVYVVASAGNTGDQAVAFPGNTGMKPQVGAFRLGVTSVDAFDDKSSFAAYGRTGNVVEMAAPGENVFGPAPGLRMASWTGTSQAAPMASGALALALGEPLWVERNRLGDFVRTTGDGLYGDGKNASYPNQIGKGRLNIETFMRSILGF